MKFLYDIDKEPLIYLSILLVGSAELAGIKTKYRLIMNLNRALLIRSGILMF